MRLRAGDINIRRVQEGDFQEILSLVHQLPGSPRLHAEENETTQAFADLIKGEAQEGFVATLCQRVVGFISLYYTRVLHYGGLVAMVQELVVTEELRGRGVGRALVDFARARAKELRCAGMEMASAWPLPGGRHPQREQYFL